MEVGGRREDDAGGGKHWPAVRRGAAKSA
jgi:hypothetical protein